MARDSEEQHTGCERMEPVIIGGMVLDVHANPSSPPLSGTTVPGQVLFRPGGVARNVAECMSKLGIKPFMISTLGFDSPANVLLAEWTLSLEGILRRGDISTPIVSHIYDIKGEVAAGVACVSSLEKFLTPEWIQQFKSNIRSAPILMVDANLSILALETSCKLAVEFGVPVWFEPVSVTKSRRITSVAKYVTVVSPNEDELIAMANALSGRDLFHFIKTGGNKLSPESIFRSLKSAIWVLLDKGIKVVILTLGPNGALLCSKGNPKTALNRSQKFPCGGEIFERAQMLCSQNHFSTDSTLDHSSGLLAVHFPALPAKVKKLTGAGDCLVGGTLASLTSGLDLIQSLAFGIATAKAAVESEVNVPPNFWLDCVFDDAKSVYHGMKILVHQSML